jgi:hypothetical protein
MTTNYQYYSSSYRHPSVLSPILEEDDSTIARFDFLEESESFDIDIDHKSFFEDLYEFLLADDSFDDDDESDCSDVTIKVSDICLQRELTELVAAEEMVPVCEDRSVVDETSFVLDTADLQAMLSICEESFVEEQTAPFHLDVTAYAIELEGMLTVCEESFSVDEAAVSPLNPPFFFSLKRASAHRKWRSSSLFLMLPLQTLRLPM